MAAANDIVEQLRLIIQLCIKVKACGIHCPCHALVAIQAGNLLASGSIGDSKPLMTALPAMTANLLRGGHNPNALTAGMCLYCRKASEWGSICDSCCNCGCVLGEGSSCSSREAGVASSRGGSISSCAFLPTDLTPLYILTLSITHMSGCTCNFHTPPILH